MVHPLPFNATAALAPVSEVTPDIRFVVHAAGDSLLASLMKCLLGELYRSASVAISGRSDESGGAELVVECETTGRRLTLFGAAPSVESVGLALRADTWSLVTIDASYADLTAALESLLDGPPFTSSTVVRHLAGDDSDADGRTRKPRLTERELEVLQLLERGGTNLEIADTLCMSANTVRSHLQTLSRKFGVHGRVKLIARARSMGVV